MSSVSNKTYYLWGEFTHAEYSLLNQLQQRVNDQFNGPDFKVHLTLSGPFHELNERILGGLEDLAVTNDSIDMRTNGYGVEDNIFQSFYIQIKLSDELLRLKRKLDDFLKIDSKNFNPHISLFYGMKELDLKNKLIKKLTSPPKAIGLDRISIVSIQDDIESWEVLYSYPLLSKKSANMNLGRPV